MSYIEDGRGKTAPKLFHDFLLFDPLSGQINANYITDISPPVGEGQQIAPVAGSCKHEYTSKSRQSFTPPLDLRPDGGTEYKTAVVCKRCRIHADIRISFAYTLNPCPNGDYPLHHFQRVRERDSWSDRRITYAWRCSAVECRGELLITFKLPRLDDTDKNLLTDTELLRNRYEAVVRDDPGREGIRQATPVEALSRLRKYIRDSLNPVHDKRTFPANNKRFMEAFGVRGRDCASLLDRLGFKYADNNWTLPNPPQLENRSQADGTTQREMLEDVEHELLAWMFKISAETGAVNPAASEGWSLADRDIERTLSVQGYPRHPTLRRAGASNEEVPYFYSLGALPDFSDSLVEFAFERQSLVDPQRRPYYYECLQVITDARGTEQLQVKVATLASEELVSRRDLNAAYRCLNIALSESHMLSDEGVIGRFQALQTDLGPSGQEEARQALYKIGQSRHSNVLINASKQKIETYEDALTWLGNGVERNTSDEALLAVAAIKVSDHRSNEEIAQTAIAVIAKERKSNLLNNWVMTGRSDGYTMSVDEALRHLNIDQKLEDVDKSIIPVLFDTARFDRPGETTEKAIATLTKALEEMGTAGGHTPESWPVGLVSHGNTCYLNSLLQYYFSIKPLRDIILAYDKYKLDTAQSAEKSERVGHRTISMVEIRGGQRFADDLKHLFERMIREPGPAVKPEEELVCRAFLEPKDYALLAVSSETPLQENILEDAVNEPLPDESAQPNVRRASDASSATLQDDSAGATTKTGDLPPTPPASPGLSSVDPPSKATNAPPLPPRRFSTTTTEEALQKARANAKQQQDVTEVHDGIMFRLRSGMQPEGKDESGEQIDALRRLFSIEMLETSLKDGVEQKPKSLVDSSIQLDVPTEATDIYSALDAVFDLQTFSEDSKLETYKSIQQLPPLLQISIPRIGYDTENGGAYKSEACVRLEDELILDRYFDKIHPDILPRRKSCWQWRKQLRTLEKEQKALSQTPVELDGPTAVTESGKYLSAINVINDNLSSMGITPIEIDPDLPLALDEDALNQNRRLSSLRTETESISAQIRDQFANMNTVKYRLAAVFFHRGSYGHGHYWIYIHDFRNNIWRSYNDERVEEFTKLDEIYEANNWNQGTPTYAVYVKSDQLDLVEAVHRAPEMPTVSDSSATPPAEQRATGGGRSPAEIDGVVGDWNSGRRTPEDIEMQSMTPRSYLNSGRAPSMWTAVDPVTPTSIKLKRVAPSEAEKQIQAYPKGG